MWYDVIVTRDLTESTVIRVQAQNEHEAEDLALRTSEKGLIWEIDDGSQQDGHYVTDVSEVEP